LIGSIKELRARRAIEESADLPALHYSGMGISGAPLGKDGIGGKSVETVEWSMGDVENAGNKSADLTGGPHAPSRLGTDAPQFFTLLL